MTSEEEERVRITGSWPAILLDLLTSYTSNFFSSWRGFLNAVWDAFGRFAESILSLNPLRMLSAPGALLVQLVFAIGTLIEALAYGPGDAVVSVVMARLKPPKSWKTKIIRLDVAFDTVLYWQLAANWAALSNRYPTEVRRIYDFQSSFGKIKLIKEGQFGKLIQKLLKGKLLTLSESIVKLIMGLLSHLALIFLLLTTWSLAIAIGNGEFLTGMSQGRKRKWTRERSYKRV